MIKKTPEEIIKAELREGEKLLWSYVISHDEPYPVKVMNSKILKLLSTWLHRFLMLVSGLYAVRFVFTAPPAEFAHLLKIQLPVFVFLILLTFFLGRTNALQKLEEVTTYLIYGSCIITDRRVLLFNHHAPERQEFAPEDIADVHLDYDNGGRALRFKPNTQDKDAVLIGIANFEAALAVLHPFRDAA